MNGSNRRNKEPSSASPSRYRPTTAGRSSFRLVLFGSLLVLLATALTASLARAQTVAAARAFAQRTSASDRVENHTATETCLHILFNDHAPFADFADQLTLWKSKLAVQSQVSNSDANPWQEIEEQTIRNRPQRSAGPRTYRTLKLDRAKLASILAKAPMEFSDQAKTEQAPVVLPV